MSSTYAYANPYPYNPAQAPPGSCYQYPQSYSQQYYPRPSYNQSPQQHQHHRHPYPHRPMSSQPGQSGSDGNNNEQPTSPSSSSTADTTLKPFWPCLDPTCALRSVGFARKADLERHYKVTHEWQFTERFDCEHPLCGRKGSNGFTRKDKMVEHMREVHRADLPKRQTGGKTGGRRGS